MVIVRLIVSNNFRHGPGDDRSVYRAFARWEQKAIFDILWAILLTKCDNLQGVDWHWQSADGCLGKARGFPESGVGKRGRKTSASAQTQPIALNQASRKSC